MEKEELYSKIYDISNLIYAWRKARKGKTRKIYVMEFEQETLQNLLKLQEELKNETYFPKPLVTFVLRDPKTRKISKSDFRDRIVHHAICNVISPIFEKTFIYDSCANQKGKGNLFALERFEKFQRKVTNNWKSEGFCLKADIKHYFEEVNHQVLMEIIYRKIKDEKVLNLIIKILENTPREILGESEQFAFDKKSGGGAKEDSKSQMQIANQTRNPLLNKVGIPLGNLTSQFFANIYLNELDYFVKHKLKAKFYIRYVDDFVILHESKDELEKWQEEIDRFLRENLKLELHPQKSKIISLSQGIDFVGFRNFYHFRILRKRNIRKMQNKVKKFKEGEISKENLLESFQGWNAYAKWADTLKLRRKVVREIYKQ